MAVPVQLIEHAAQRFHLLGDPTRLRLLNELDADDEVSVGDLAARTGCGVSNTSKHLHLLEREGIVARRRVGTTILYRIADSSIRELCDLVCASLRDRYAGLADAGA